MLSCCPQYRDSKLTHLLKTSLEGDCKLIMIANINPAHHVFEDSHNTLKVGTSSFSCPYIMAADIAFPWAYALSH